MPNPETRVKLGPCDVTLYHPSLGALALGLTKGGATATYTPDYYESTADQTGSTPIEHFLVGEMWQAEFSLMEWSLPNLRAAFGSAHTLAGDDAVSIGSKVGKRSSTNAGLLLLHPVDLTTTEFDFGIYRAVSVGEIKVEHKSDGERLIPLLVKGIIDPNRANGDQLGFIGDSIS